MELVSEERQMGSPHPRVDEILRHLREDRDLPTLSPVLEKILKILEDDSASVREIAEVIKHDVSISVRILKVVNSAYYGLTRQVATLPQAIVILGLSVVKNLALSMSILELFIRNTTRVSDVKVFRTFWERSLLAAVSAKKLAQLVHAPEDEEAFMAALLQDVGGLIFIKHYPEEYAKLLETTRLSAVDLAALEEMRFGINHAHVGEMLTSRWQLPQILTAPILLHHEAPSTLLSRGEEFPSNVLRVVQFVNLSNLVAAIFHESHRLERIEHLKEVAGQTLQIAAEDIDLLLSSLTKDVKEISNFFNLPQVDLRHDSELLLAANVELGKLNLDYEQINNDLAAAKRQAEALAEQLAVANLRLEEMASLDELTQIHNRRAFQTMLTHEFYRAQRYKHTLSCIMMDLDRFKQINDSQGHLVGDQVLRSVATTLKDNLRKSDFLARYGGDEFVVLLPEANEQATQVISDKLRRAVACCPIEIEGKPHFISITTGEATYSEEFPLACEEELLQRADLALYHAKHHSASSQLEFS